MLFIVMALASAAFGAAQAKDAPAVPVWFDAFQAPLESRAGWQTFQAAYALEFVSALPETGRPALKAKARFSKTNLSAVLIWRFPDLQMHRFRARIMVPANLPAGDVFFQMVANNTQGDALFFKPYLDGKPTYDLPCQTIEGLKQQPASPLPHGKWAVYDVGLPGSLFFEQKKGKAAHPVQDMALMNTGRDALNLSAESRPAMEVFFMSFQVPDNSPLLDKEVWFYIDLVEIY
ncbi:MAG: hypothetical protein K9M54_12335 [Kiritimatiellales bacterium]|nr:hypothetical protein [Kiritimatiellales bacterium]